MPPADRLQLHSRTLTLTREVRFWLDPRTSAETPVGGGFGGVAAPPSVVAYFELAVTVEGEPDPQTGYLLGIQHIDAAVRTEALPPLAARWRRSIEPGHDPLDPVQALVEIFERLDAVLPVTLRSVAWRLTPFHLLEIERSSQRSDEHPMPTTPPRLALLRQRFEFCAAHRLHCADLDDAENRRIFGKCNLPNGHGHNYRLEVAVAVPLQGGGPTPRHLEAIVGEQVIEPFDHRHLNLDIEAFRGLNPSVEHIARICFERLDRPVAAAGGTLRQVTVWETDKTSCTYPDQPAGVAQERPEAPAHHPNTPAAVPRP